MNKRRGWMLGLAATIAYSTNMPIARGAIVAGMHPITLLAARFVFATILFGVAMRATSLGNSAESKPLNRTGLTISILSGLINGVMLAAFFTALQTVSASIASMTTISLSQLFTLGILMLRGERLTQRNLIRLLLSLPGLYLLVGPGGAIDPTGLLLLVIGSALFSIHIVSVQWFLKPYNTWSITTLIVTSATVAILMLWVGTGMETFVPSPIGWIAIILLGLVATFIGRILTYSAINTIGSGQFAMLSPLETSLAIVWAAIFLGERLSTVQWIGAVLILLSTLLAIDMVWQGLGFTTDNR